MINAPKTTVYFALLAIVLISNAGLSFYYSVVAEENHLNLLQVMEFQANGARYTFADGERDRAERDRVFAEFRSRIEQLEAKLQ